MSSTSLTGECKRAVDVSNGLQEAQLSQRERATLHVTEYFAKSLEAIQGHSK